MFNEVSINPSKSSVPTTFGCSQVPRNLLFVLPIIVGIGISLAGFLGIYSVSFFGGMGTVSAHVLAYGGIVTVIITASGKIAIMYCTSKPTPPVQTKEMSSQPEIEKGADSIKDDKEIKPDTLPTRKMVAEISYQPLIELISRRQQILYAPQFTFEAVVHPTPTTFPYLDKVVVFLGDPELKFGSIPEYESQINDLASVIKGILNGKCTSFRQEGKGITHPSQFKLVTQYAKKYLKALNDQLEVLKGRASPQTYKTFILQFREVSSVIDVWEKLTMLAQKPILEDSDLELLCTSTESLPEASSPFYTDYPHIEGLIGSQMQNISKIIVRSKKSLKTIHDIEHNIEKKLGFKISFKSPQDALNAFIECFKAQLDDDVMQLLDDVKTKQDLDQVLNYIGSETNALNEAIAQCVQHHHTLELQFHKTTNEQMIEDIDALHFLSHAWGSIAGLLIPDDIDEKIALIAEIAQNLPAPNAKLWGKYPAIRERVGENLNRLGFVYFSDYVFETMLLEDNQEKFEADQIRRATFHEAVELMGKKLGCQRPQLPKIEMFTANDGGIRVEEQKAEIVEIANQMTSIYFDHLDNGHDIAVGEVYMNLTGRFQGLIQRRELIQLVVNELTDPTLKESLNQFLRT